MREIAIKLGESKCPDVLETFRDEILDITEFRDDLCLDIKAERVREVLRFLKETPSQCFEFLMDLFGMDYQGLEPKTPERFAVVYGLYSYSRRARLRVRAMISEKDAKIDSIHDIYRAANWFEREAWDMFGIDFVGHPNQKRILCHHEFEGHPLRKDFPSDNYQRLRTALPSSEL